MTPTPPAALTLTDVWSRRQPSLSAPLYMVIPKGTPLIVRSVYGRWLDVEWTHPKDGYQRVWVPALWVRINEPVPAMLITPTP